MFSCFTRRIFHTSLSDFFLLTNTSSVNNFFALFVRRSLLSLSSLLLRMSEMMPLAADAGLLYALILFDILVAGLHSDADRKFERSLTYFF